MRKALTVAVLGAGGIIAPAIVRDLADSEEVQAMRLLDLDGARAAEVASQYGAGRASAEAVDARDGLAGVLENCDVLVNSASYRINLDAMRACLSAGCHYLDLGGLYWLTGEQLDLHGEFERAGLVAVLGIGSSPGKTNLMALEAVRRLEGEIESVHVAAAGRDPEAPPGLSLPYALRTLIDELTMAPVAVREGKPVELEPLSPGGVVDYGPADRRGRDDLHAPLRAAHLPRQLRLPRDELPSVARAGALRPPRRADRELARGGGARAGAGEARLAQDLLRARGGRDLERWPQRPRVLPDPSARELAAGRRRCVHGVAGSSSRAPARAGEDRGPGRPAARAVHRA